MQSLWVCTSRTPFLRKVLEDQRESINQTKGLRGIQETERKGNFQDDEVSSLGLLMYLGAEEPQVSLVLKVGSGKPGSKKMKLNTWCVWMNPERTETAESCGWMGGEGGKGTEGKKETLTEEKPLNSHFRSSVQQYWPLPSVLSVLSLQNTEFNETDSLLISNWRQYWGGFGLGPQEC